jgi:hypothetical protein
MEQSLSWGRWQGSFLQPGSGIHRIHIQMIALVLQIVILCLLVASIVVWAIYFPDPSPLIRRWLAPRKHWPEA